LDDSLYDSVFVPEGPQLAGGEALRSRKALSFLLIRFVPSKEGTCPHDWTK